MPRGFSCLISLPVGKEASTWPMKHRAAWESADCFVHAEPGGRLWSKSLPANNTPFGLSAGIATSSLKYATHFKRYSQAGMVMVNLPTAGVDYHVPFGGRKGSSYGSREQGRYAQEFFTTVKTAYVGS